MLVACGHCHAVSFETMLIALCFFGASSASTHGSWRPTFGKLLFRDEKSCVVVVLIIFSAVKKLILIFKKLKNDN